MIIFKYFRWNEFAKRLFSDGELFFCSPKNTNDPYDYQADIVFHGPEVVKKIKALPDEIREPLIAKCKVSEDHTQPIFDAHKNEMLKYGICCFSHSYNSQLMWAHYAEQHKGICVGFDTNLLKTDGVEFRDINYRLVPPTVNILGTEEEFLQQASSKYIEWSYEKEIRAIKKFDQVLPDDDNNRKWIINKEAIQYVLMGYRTSLEQSQEISTCYHVGGLKARVYHMSPDSSDGGYGLYPLKII